MRLHQLPKASRYACDGQRRRAEHVIGPNEIRDSARVDVQGQDHRCGLRTLVEHTRSQRGSACSTLVRRARHVADHSRAPRELDHPGNMRARKAVRSQPGPALDVVGDLFAQRVCGRVAGRLQRAKSTPSLSQIAVRSPD